MANIDINHYVVLVQDEIKLVFSTLKDKGSERFGRALIIGLGLPVAVYMLVYGPADRKLSHLDNDLNAARNTAKYADSYKDLKDRLVYAYLQLPLPKDRKNFLTDSVKAALHSQKIVATEFRPPTDEESNGIVVQNLSITMNVKFSDLMAFLTQIDATKPMIHVSAVEIMKRAEPIGRNDVTVGLSTIILTERY
jgi:Tfp pilus assembly protein PilO